MFIDIGNDYILKASDVVGVFDLDNISVGKGTRLFLERAEKDGKIVNAAKNNLPRSLLLTENSVYLSFLNVSTILKRHLQKKGL